MTASSSNNNFISNVIKTWLEHQYDVTVSFVKQTYTTIMIVIAVVDITIVIIIIVFIVFIIIIIIIIVIVSGRRKTRKETLWAQ